LGIWRMTDKIQSHSCETTHSACQCVLERLKKLEEQNKIMREALKNIDIEWCKHTEMGFDKYPYLDRNWCSQCGNYIYRDEVNPAHETLKQIEEMEGKKK